MKYIEEDITLAEFAERFLGVNDFESPGAYDMTDMGIEVETIDPDTGNKIFAPISSFLVKEPVDEYYTDGFIKGTANHRVIEDGKEIHLKDHPEFKKIDGYMNVVDIEVDNFSSYLANGRLHHNTTSGGKAIAFHASTRIRLSLTGKIKNTEGDVIGVKVKAVLEKNRLGPPHRTAEFEIYFNRGIDDYSAWIKVLKDHKIIKQSGAWYTYIDETTGEEIKFQSKDFPNFIDVDPERKELLYDKMCEALIMRYQTEFDPDNVSIMEAGDE